MWMWQDTLLQQCVKFGVNLTFFAPWLPWQPPLFWICSTHQKVSHTTVDIHAKFHEVWWKESKNKWIPLFCFHGNCGNVCPIDLDCFGLSRSTGCGCCSYQVSSISVQRITCYDHFCVFQFFTILAVSMAKAAILKKNQPLKAQLHMAYDIPPRFHKVWLRHLREIERTKCVEEW